MKNAALDKVTLPAGAVIHYRGMPFRLPVETVVEGRAANLALANAVHKQTSQIKNPLQPEGQRG